MKVTDWITKHAPAILSILGCAGLVATTVDAIRCTNKRNAKITKDSSVVEVIKDYGTTIALGAGTIGCVLGANVLNQKHQALLTSAYTLVAHEFDQYKNKVISLCGKETDYSVEKAVAEEQRAKDEGLPGLQRLKHSTLNLMESSLNLRWKTSCKLSIISIVISFFEDTFL